MRGSDPLDKTRQRPVHAMSLAVFRLIPIVIGARMVPLLLEPTEADALGAGYENDLLPAPREG